LKKKIRAVSGCAAFGLTVKALLEILRGNARRLSLPSDLATAVGIDPGSGRFALTRAQTDWLGGRGRTLVLAGVLTHARVCSPAYWERWRREVAIRLAESDAARKWQS
jgi:hypothetical protein